MGTINYMTVYEKSFLIGTHYETDSIQMGSTVARKPGLLIGKRTSDKKGMVSRFATVDSLNTKTITLSESGLAAFFNEGETLTLRHKVTALVREVIDTSARKAITDITKADPGVVTCTAHGLTDGDKVRIVGVEGMVEVNFNIYTVTVTDENEFSIVDTSSGFTAYTSGGFAEPVIAIYEDSWTDESLGLIADVDTDNNTLTYAGTPSNTPTAGDYVLIKDGSETPIGILHTAIDPNDDTISMDARYVWHCRADKNRVLNWHDSFEALLPQIKFVDKVEEA